MLLDLKQIFEDAKNNTKNEEGDVSGFTQPENYNIQEETTDENTESKPEEEIENKSNDQDVKPELVKPLVGLDTIYADLSQFIKEFNRTHTDFLLISDNINGFKPDNFTSNNIYLIKITFYNKLKIKDQEFVFFYDSVIFNLKEWIINSLNEVKFNLLATYKALSRIYYLSDLKGSVLLNKIANNEILCVDSDQDITNYWSFNADNNVIKAQFKQNNNKTFYFNSQQNMFYKQNNVILWNNATIKDLWWLNGDELLAFFSAGGTSGCNFDFSFLQNEKIARYCLTYGLLEEEYVNVLNLSMLVQSMHFDLLNYRIYFDNYDPENTLPEDLRPIYLTLELGISLNNQWTKIQNYFVRKFFANLYNTAKQILKNNPNNDKAKMFLNNYNKLMVCYFSIEQAKQKKN